MLKAFLLAFVVLSSGPALAAIAFDQDRYVVSFCAALQAGASIKAAVKIALDDSYLPGVQVSEEEAQLRQKMRVALSFRSCRDSILAAPKE